MAYCIIVSPLKLRSRKRHEKPVSSFSGKGSKHKGRKALTAQENPRPFRREWQKCRGKFWAVTWNNSFYIKYSNRHSKCLFIFLWALGFRLRLFFPQFLHRHKKGLKKGTKKRGVVAVSGAYAPEQTQFYSGNRQQ